MVRIKVTKDLTGISAKADSMIDKGQFALANQVYADMNNYVPALNYDLRNQSAIAPDNKSIYYNVPYARRQFYTQFQNYTTPGTGPRWDLKAKSIHGDSWARVAKAAMK